MARKVKKTFLTPGHQLCLVNTSVWIGRRRKGVTVLLGGSGTLPYQRLPVLSSGALGKLSGGRGPDRNLWAPL